MTFASDFGMRGEAVLRVWQGQGLGRRFQKAFEA